MAEKIDLRPRILEIIQAKGPVIPRDIIKEIGGDTFIIGAVLMQLKDAGSIIVSNTKVGGSPAYYCQGQEEKLQELSKYLNEKEKYSYALLKEHKILRDYEEQTIVRFTLRQIKDFAIPLVVSVNGTDEIFWKWYLTPLDEAEILINQIIDNIPQSHELETAVDVKEDKIEKPELVVENKSKVEVQDINQEVSQNIIQNEVLVESDNQDKTNQINVLVENENINVETKHNILVEEKHFVEVYDVKEEKELEQKTDLIDEQKEDVIVLESKKVEDESELIDNIKEKELVSKEVVEKINELSNSDDKYNEVKVEVQDEKIDVSHKKELKENKQKESKHSKKQSKIRSVKKAKKNIPKEENKSEKKSENKGLFGKIKKLFWK